MYKHAAHTSEVKLAQNRVSAESRGGEWWVRGEVDTREDNKELGTLLCCISYLRYICFEYVLFLDVTKKGGIVFETRIVLIIELYLCVNNFYRLPSKLYFSFRLFKLFAYFLGLLTERWSCLNFWISFSGNLLKIWYALWYKRIMSKKCKMKLKSLVVFLKENVIFW